MPSSIAVEECVDVSSVSLPSMSEVDCDTSTCNDSVGSKVCEEDVSLFSDKEIKGVKMKCHNTSGKAIAMVKSRKCQQLCQCIKSIGTTAEQVQMLSSVLTDPSMKAVSKGIGLKLPHESLAVMYNHQQMQKSIQQASKTQHSKG